MNKSQHQGFVVSAPLTVFLAVVLLAGCDLPERPPLDASDVRPSRFVQSSRVEPEVVEPDVLEAPGEHFEGPWETWDAYLVRGQHVGYAHVVAEALGNKVDSDVRYQLESRFHINQGRARFLQRLTQTSTETTDGRLKGFESVLQVGPAVTEFVGTVSDGNLYVETIRGSSRTTRTVPWQSTYRGLVALEQSLRQRPMKTKGESRALRILLSGQYELATARLRCNGKASVPLIDGTLAELLEIDCEMEVDEKQATYSTIWTNDKGGIVRTFSPALRLVAYRTDEITATKFKGSENVVAATIVVGRIDRPNDAKRVAYRITPTAAASESATSIDFQPAPGQYIRAVDGGAFQVLVSRSPENVAKGFVGSELIPSDGDLQPNYFVDSNEKFIQQFAVRVGSSDMTDRQIAVELMRSAHGLVEKGESAGFSRASDFNHPAILLAAFLRARKIPSRLAIGVKYSSGEPSRMAYHCWTLAYVEGDWIHLDASDGRLAAADRLIFSTTNLAGGNEYEPLISLLDLIGRVEIQVVGAQN